MRYKSDSKSGIIIDVTDKTSASYFRIVDKVVFISSQTPNRIATPTHIHWLYLLINKQKTSENDFRGLRTTCAQVYIASKIVFLLLTVLPAFHWIHRLITSLFRALPKHCFIGIGWTFHPSDTIGMVVLIREKLHDCFVIYVSCLGNVNEKWLIPLADVTLICPPCCSTISFAIARPNPDPPTLRCREASRR